MTNTKKLVESAILIAIATILSMIKIIDFPWGGGITIFAMLPMIMLSYKYGMKWGFVCASAFALIQLAIGVATNSFGLELLPLIIMLILDYIVAYMALALGGAFRNKFKSALPALICGAIVAVCGRYIVHMISGAIFYGSYAEWFFKESGFNTTIGQAIMDTVSGATLGIVYSIILNGITMVCELAITIVGAIAVAKIPVISKSVQKVALKSSTPTPSL